MTVIPSSGKGFLVPLISFGTLLATEWLVEAQFHDDRYYQQHGWPMGLAFALAALVVAAISKSLRERSETVLIDPATGREVVIVSDQHSFLFIPMRYWPVLLLLLGLVFSFVPTDGS